MNKPYRLGVNAVIIDKDNNVLLIQKNAYKDNEWNLLGGGREEGESLEQNLFRELEEELGLKSNSFSLIGVSKFKVEYDYPPEIAQKVNGGKYRGQSYDQVVVRFVGDKSKLIFTPEEFRDHKWVKISDLSSYLVFPNQFDRVKLAINEILPETVK